MCWQIASGIPERTGSLLENKGAEMCRQLLKYGPRRGASSGGLPGLERQAGGLTLPGLSRPSRLIVRGQWSVHRKAGDIQIVLERPDDGLARLNQNCVAGISLARYRESSQAHVTAGVQVM